MENPYQSPETEIVAPDSTNPHTPLAVLFSLKGRIRRRTFWLGQIGLIIILAIASRVTEALMAKNEEPGMEFFNMLILYWLIAAYGSFALSAKRWHDLDRSGWWCLLLLVPYLGWFAVLIENGFLQGIEGPNRFGPDPRTSME